MDPELLELLRAIIAMAEAARREYTDTLEYSAVHACHTIRVPSALLSRIGQLKGYTHGAA